MRVYFTKHFPFGNFRAINLFSRLYFKDETGRYSKNMMNHPERYSRLIQHERTHTKQMHEMGYILFYIWYIVEWFIKLFTEGKAYENVSFEREARAMEKEPDEYELFTEFRNEIMKSHYLNDDLNATGEELLEGIEYLEFIPLNLKGSLTHRKPWNWTKYIFHR